MKMPIIVFDINKLYKILSYLSLLIVILSASYGIVMTVVKGYDPVVVGQAFVEVEFPPIEIFPYFYMKPITWLTFSIITLVYCTYSLNKERIAKLPSCSKGLVKLITFIIGTLSIYEILFNFTLWSGLIASAAVLGELNPDIMINPFPNPKIPWNIVFTTKMYFIIFIVCSYTFYFLTKLEQSDYT